MNRENILKVIGRASGDTAFCKRLKEDPRAVCNQQGGEIPDSVNVQVIEVGPLDVCLTLGNSSGVPAFDSVLERANGDAEFRQRLVANPRFVLETALGEKIPANSKVSVLEKAEDTVRLFISKKADELSDNELEAVAGGGFFKNIANLFCRDSYINITVKSADGQSLTSTQQRDSSIGGPGAPYDPYVPS